MRTGYNWHDVAAMPKHWATKLEIPLISQLKLICRKDIAMKLIAISYSQQHCDLPVPSAAATEIPCGPVPVWRAGRLRADPAISGVSGAG
jgi:hypothetical protein